MFEGRQVLALIPARGGSKGVPGKNIRPLAGKPLIAWTIEAAKASCYVDRLIVSTDSEEIAKIATSWGAEIPFLRPSHLATDAAKGMDVVLHALDQLRQKLTSTTLVLLLQPTSPLRTTTDIDNAVELLGKKKARAIVSVCPVEHHPWWANTLPDDNNMANFLRPELSRTNRQELPVYYRLNGALYLADVEFIINNESFIRPESYAYIMPQKCSIDIDNRIDFELAEILLNKKY